MPDHQTMISASVNPIECLDIKFGFSNLLYVYDGSMIIDMHRYTDRIFVLEHRNKGSELLRS